MKPLRQGTVYSVRRTIKEKKYSPATIKLIWLFAWRQAGKSRRDELNEEVKNEQEL